MAYVEITDVEILSLLRESIEKEGGQSAWCRKYNVVRPYLNKVLHGSKLLGPPRDGSSVLSLIKIRLAFVRKSASPGKVKSRVITRREIVRLLTDDIERVGNQSAYARKHRVDRTYLNRVLKGAKLGGPKRTSSLVAPLNIKLAYVRDE
jgi:DNA-binding transcriptional regulator YdaS (Cro superfamily)